MPATEQYGGWLVWVRDMRPVVGEREALLGRRREVLCGVMGRKRRFLRTGGVEVVKGDS